MKRLIPLFTLLLTLTAGCTFRSERPAGAEAVNAVYYWKTSFSPDSADLAFLRRHDVGRIYLRMFDVVPARYASLDSCNTRPNATLTVSDEAYALIADSLSDIVFTPVVYITTDAMRESSGQEELLGRNIVTRVKNMCSYNGLPNVGELQLDCDWTATTEESFFALCEVVRKELSAHGLPWHLSSTIRLHQLGGTPPPVDCGVLMVYNTGSFDDPRASNSILHPSDVEPYKRKLRDYPLPLDVAYPTYSWQLIFRYDEFAGLTNGLAVGDTTLFTPCTANLFEARTDIPHHNRTILRGDRVRVEESEVDNLLEVKKLIESQMSSRPHSTILYHLDSRNLSEYTPDEIDSFYSR